MSNKNKTGAASQNTKDQSENRTENRSENKDSKSCR